MLEGIFTFVKKEFLDMEYEACQGKLSVMKQRLDQLSIAEPALLPILGLIMLPALLHRKN
jgi:hypothetical protein